MIPITDNFGFIYVFGNKEYGFYKIGRSPEPITRMRTYTKFLPFDIELIHTIDTNDMQEGERQIHSHFGAKRLRGEWFSLDSDDLEKIKSITQFTDGKFETKEGKQVEFPDEQDQAWFEFLGMKGNK